ACPGVRLCVQPSASLSGFASGQRRLQARLPLRLGRRARRAGEIDACRQLRIALVVAQIAQTFETQQAPASLTIEDVDMRHQPTQQAAELQAENPCRLAGDLQLADPAHGEADAFESCGYGEIQRYRASGQQRLPVL